MSLAILFHFLCAQHVSDINISIIRKELATILLNYHIGCIAPGSMCVGGLVWMGWSGIRVVGFSFQHTLNQEQYDQRGNSTEKSQAPDDGYINVRNMLST